MRTEQNKLKIDSILRLKEMIATQSHAIKLVLQPTYSKISVIQTIVIENAFRAGKRINAIK